MNNHDLLAFQTDAIINLPLPEKLNNYGRYPL